MNSRQNVFSRSFFWKYIFINTFFGRTLEIEFGFCQKFDFKKVFKSDFFYVNIVFFKIYVMGSTQVDLLDIVHVKVWFLAALKMCIRAGLGKFA